MRLKRLLEKQAEALRSENALLRQAVPPEKQKYLPKETENTPRPPTLKERFKKLLPKIAKALAVVVVLGGIAALIAVELMVVLPQKDKEETPEPVLPDSIPYESSVSGLNAYFGGHIAEYGDLTYFSASVNDRLYCKTPFDSSKQKERLAVKNIVAAGTNVYYINSKTSTLYAIDVHSEKVDAVGRAVCTFALPTEEGIYCIAAETGEARLYTSDGLQYRDLMKGYAVKTIDVAEDTVYILSENTLYALKGSEPAVISENVYLSGIVGDTLLFSDGEKLYEFNGSSSIPLNIAAKDFNGNSDLLVCQDPMNPAHLYLHAENGASLLVADYREGLTVTENHVVYISVDGFKYDVDPILGQRTVLS